MWSFHKRITVAVSIRAPFGSGKFQLALPTLHHLTKKMIFESASGKCAGYCLMALFPLNIMLAVVAVQCETPKGLFFFSSILCWLASFSGDGGTSCCLRCSSCTTYKCTRLYSCSCVFVAHLSWLSYVHSLWPCHCYPVFVSLFVEMRGSRHYFLVLVCY